MPRQLYYRCQWPVWMPTVFRGEGFTFAFPLLLLPGAVVVVMPPVFSSTHRASFMGQATCEVVQGATPGLMFSHCHCDSLNLFYFFTRALPFPYGPGNYVAVLLISFYSLPAFSPSFASSFPSGLSVLPHSSLSSANPTLPTPPFPHSGIYGKQQIWVT